MLHAPQGITPEVGQTIGLCRLSITLSWSRPDRPQKAMACPTSEIHRFDWAHAEHEHPRACQGESGGHYEGQVELAGAVHHEPRQRRGQHSREVTEAVLKAGPLAGC